MQVLIRRSEELACILGAAFGGLVWVCTTLPLIGAYAAFQGLRRAFR